MSVSVGEDKTTYGAGGGERARPPGELSPARPCVPGPPFESSGNPPARREVRVPLSWCRKSAHWSIEAAKEIYLYALKTSSERSRVIFADAIEGAHIPITNNRELVLSLGCFTGFGPVELVFLVTINCGLVVVHFPSLS